MKKGILIFILIVLLIGIASAATFDNVKKYDSNNNEVTIKNRFGFGSELFKAKLVENTYDCSTDCYALQTLTLYESGSLVEDLRFDLIQNNGFGKDEEAIREYHIYYKNGNSWKEFDVGDYFEVGVYEVKLEGKKKKNVVVDWVIKNNGKWLDEFAIWGVEGVDPAYVTLNSPNNESTINSGMNVKFNATGTSTSNLVNASLYFNLTGEWKLEETTTSLSGGSVVNQSHNGTIDAAQPNDVFPTGVEINTTSSGIILYLNYVYVSPSSTATTILLQNESGINISSAKLVGTKAVFNNITLYGDRRYRILAWNNGTSFSQGNIYTGSLPYEREYLNYSAGFANGGNRNVGGSLFAITEVHVATGATTKEIQFVKNLTNSGVWNVQFCDLDGDCGFHQPNNYTLNVLSFERAISFNDITTEGNQEEFSLLLNLTGTKQLSSATLFYNNVEFSSPFSSLGSGGYNISKNIEIPQVSSESNLTFYWEIVLNSGETFNSSFNNQTVQDINIDDCSAYTYTLLNLSLVDENSKISLGAANESFINVDVEITSNAEGKTILNYSNNFTNSNNALICLDNNLSSSSYLLNSQIQYGASNYSKELYHISNQTINISNLYNNITLYDLISANAQKFVLVARDGSYLPYDEALIQIERKYIEDGEFLITEIPKTDSRGITSASLELNDVIYNFKIYKNGVLLSSFLNVLAICQTPLVSECEIDFNSFQTGIPIPDYEDGDDFNFTLDYNSSSRVVTSNFLIPSSTSSYVELIVIKEDSLGTSICTDSLNSSLGQLSCTVPNNFGNATILAKLYKDGVEQGKGNIKLDQDPSDIFGVILIVLSLMVLLTLVGIGVSDNPIITVVFLFVGFILLISMNLVKNTGFIGATATILFLGIAVVIIMIKAGRRS